MEQIIILSTNQLSSIRIDFNFLIRTKSINTAIDKAITRNHGYGKSLIGFPEIKWSTNLPNPSSPPPMVIITESEFARKSARPITEFGILS